jgi:putative ABC transport system substrate-binding protein
MRRRDFLTLLGGAAATWPLGARAQQSGTVRRVGVLMGWSESDPQWRSLLAVFVQGLAQLDWVEGRNLQIDVRWTNGEVNRALTFAKELVELRPDVILAGSTPVTAALQRQTSATPIVFVIVADPVGSRFVAGLPRPGGNITGFINGESTMGGKWLELLREIAPGVRRAAIMFNPDTAPSGGAYYLSSFEAAARALVVEPITAAVHGDTEIEGVITSLGREQAGLVIMPDSFMVVHQAAVISLAARNNVPVVGADLPDFTKNGGLLSYGPNFQDIFRRAPGYVDRILKGEKPVNLPVQAPTKFDLIINLKTAKALGLTVPPLLVARADEVIE